MKNKLKKIVSLLLMLAVLIGTVPITASAATNGKTAVQATDWARQQVNSPTDFDGGYGIQCVDLIVGYYRYLGQSSPYGNGCDYATNSLPSGWNRIAYYGGFIPNPGDIAVWTYASSSYGHVAIVLSADSSGFTVAQFNGSTHTGSTQYYSYSYGTLYGFIRPDFNGNGVPTDVWVSLPDGPESKYGVNCSVDISFGAKNATQFNLYIFRGSEKYWYGEFSSNNGQAVCNALFDKTGHYSCYVQAVNSSGYATSGWIGWDIIDAKPTVSKVEIVGSSEKSFPKGSTLTFKFTTDNTTEKISWGITKDGKLLEWRYTTDQTLTYTFNDVGSYYIEIDAVNKYGATRSNKVYFDIVNHNHSYTSAVTKEPTCTEKGTRTFTCSCGDSYTEPVDALGHSYKSVVTPPTCTAQGYTTHTCTRPGCGYSYKNSYVAAKGHTPGEWHVTKEPTTTSTGTKTQYCSECGQAVKTETIPKLEQPQGTVQNVVLNDLELNYKQTSSLNPEITADSSVSYKVSYESSNPNIIRVDENGSVYAAKTGSAKITVTVTDTSTGRTVSDDCIVNVSYSALQWFIMIVLFGWLWY